jgi:hypothetical protein
MAFPTPATSTNCDASTDDPKQALLVDLYQLIQKFNQLLSAAAAAGPLSGSGITGAAPLASPALTGTPTAPTPAQFDSDTSIATTAFVQSVGLHSAGFGSYSASATLGSADIGRSVFYNGNSPGTLTLPDSVALGLQVGSLLIASCVGTGTLTLARAGTAGIYAYGLYGVTSLTLKPGDGVALAWNGGDWIQVGGTARLSGDSTRTYSVAAGVAATDAVNVGQFPASLVANGYQKLPSGLIIQWGSQYVAAGTTGTYAFPITFPNSAIQLIAGEDIDGPNSNSRNDSTGGKAISNSQYQLRQGSSFGGMTIHWVCFGY